jgi:hypothetical protein
MRNAGGRLRPIDSTTIGGSSFISHHLAPPLVARREDVDTNVTLRALPDGISQKALQLSPVPLKVSETLRPGTLPPIDREREQPRGREVP